MPSRGTKRRMRAQTPSAASFFVASLRRTSPPSPDRPLERPPERPPERPRGRPPITEEEVASEFLLGLRAAALRQRPPSMRARERARRAAAAREAADRRRMGAPHGRAHPSWAAAAAAREAARRAWAEAVARRPQGQKSP
jgi:hypothetical protein